MANAEPCFLSPAGIPHFAYAIESLFSKHGQDGRRFRMRLFSTTLCGIRRKTRVSQTAKKKEATEHGPYVTLAPITVSPYFKIKITEFSFSDYCGTNLSVLSMAVIPIASSSHIAGTCHATNIIIDVIGK